MKQTVPTMTASELKDRHSRLCSANSAECTGTISWVKGCNGTDSWTDLSDALCLLLEGTGTLAEPCLFSLELQGFTVLPVLVKESLASTVFSETVEFFWDLVLFGAGSLE